MESFDAISKVIVIGNSNVGKTCLILRYTQDMFRESFLPTIGVDFRSKALIKDGKRYKLQLWDTAGQERYNSLRRGYYRGAKDDTKVSVFRKGVIIVYDITDQTSFENVTRWSEDVITHMGPFRPHFLIVGNKADLAEKRSVTYESGAQLATEYGACFGEVSAKSGAGVDETFQRFESILMQEMDRVEKSVIEFSESRGVDISTWEERKENDARCCGKRTQAKEKIQFDMIT